MPVLYRLALATVLAFSLVPQFVAAQSTCEPYDDHWHCPPGVSPPITPPPQPPSATSLCASTTGYVGIATTVTDYDAFTRSLNSVHRTTGAPSLSGTRVPVYTTTRTFPSLGLITAYGYYDSHALSSAGFSFVSGLTVVTTACSPNTPTLPPSPTGSICSPHGDHCSNPAPSTSSPLTRGKDNPAGYRQQPPACAVEPTLVGNFVSMATNDRQLRCLDTGPSR
ncbi:hypothetical protein MGG_17855 [Pyricularia oryzae 70-15]|uniref:Uncharacterized protein n=1 Tax=Pyricularia oryzae (strain 70-15 / ATCC MYA-4617 / FGSC 8958) TaxID=242507 RepID=G4NK00_PYRO7|nr:uncharacterized protein MGG_17855 [Pyricularia oryzae 70-15]EHA45768.1 hypothetical protein MGG_17855 [Pyricularia oryzae 70-15]